jgi:hypothetical protein
MIHAIIIRPDKFQTACNIRFNGQLLKGKKFDHLTSVEFESIQCLACKEKVGSLRKKPVYYQKGGRAILLDLDEV